jgi:hypothetical protein
MCLRSFGLYFSACLGDNLLNSIILNNSTCFGLYNHLKLVV